MKFDVVVGNPPYQEAGEARDEPIFHYFYDLAEKVGEKYCLISPARFLFNAGQTPKHWNEKMLACEQLKVVLYQQDSSKIFPITDITGGLTVIYHDKKQSFGAIGTFSHFSELTTVSQKVKKLKEPSFAELVQAQGIYRFSKEFFSDFPQAESIQGKGTKNKIVSKSLSGMAFAFFEHSKSQQDVKLLGLVKGKRQYKWIDKKYLSFPESFDKWKVFVPEANGSGAIGEVQSTPLIGEPLVGEPLVGHTDTFLTIGGFDTKVEAMNVLQYIKTKFARTMLGVLKITQHNSRSTWQNVPLQDFTANSDIDWSKSISAIDQQLYRKYGLDQSEIDFIETKVRAME